MVRELAAPGEGCTLSGGANRVEGGVEWMQGCRRGVCGRA